MHRFAFLLASALAVTVTTMPRAAFAADEAVPDEEPAGPEAEEPLPPPPLPATQTPPTKEEPAPSARGPVVELAADDGRAVLERRLATSTPGGAPFAETGLFSVGHWQHACVAPCRIAVDPRFAYRVAGDGLVPTGSFALPSTQDRVRVEAKMGSSGARVAGVLATGAGALAIAAGGLALVATPILASEDVGSEGFRTAVFAGGLGAVSVGLVAATVGLYLWLSNGSSARTEIAAR
jgi:hypothetical protein